MQAKHTFWKVAINLDSTAKMQWVISYDQDATTTTTTGKITGTDWR